MPLWFGLGTLLVVEALFFWGAWAVHQENQRFLDGAVRTLGTILELHDRESHSQANGTTVSTYPSIGFVDAHGQSRRFEADSAVDEDEYPVGEPIPLVYRPDNPDPVRIDEFSNFGLNVWFLAGFGIACTGAGLLVWAVSSDSLFLVAHGVPVQGTVVQTQGSPRIEFVAPNGRTYHRQAQRGDEKHPASAGDRVTLLSDPGHPGRSRVNSFGDLWFPTALVGGFAVFFGLISLGLLAFRLWPRRGKPE